MKSNALASIRKQKLQNAAPQPNWLAYFLCQLQYNEHWNTAEYNNTRLCLSDNLDWDNKIKESEDEKEEKEKNKDTKEEEKQAIVS